MAERIEGTVDWFGSKGMAWGYINYGDGQSIFVHYKNICPKNQKDEKYKTLDKGQLVSFELSTGFHTNGTQAINVEVKA